MRAFVPIGLAFGIRLAWILCSGVEPHLGFHYDMSWYHHMGLRLLDGHGVTRPGGEPTAEWPPAYPAFLALLYGISGRSVLVAQIANAALGALTCATVYRIAGAVGGGRAAVLAAVLFALWPGDVLFAPLLLSEPLFNTLLYLSMVLLVRRESALHPLRAGIAGGLLGAATLVRAVGLAMLLPALARLAVASGPRRVRGAAAAALLGGVVLFTGPWIARNFWQLDGFIGLATSLGRTLAHTHGPAAGSDLAAARRRMEVWRQYEGIPYPEREVVTNRAFTNEVIAWTLAHPGDVIRGLPGRLARFYGSDHAGLRWAKHARLATENPLRWQRVDAVLAGVADAYFFLACASAVAGLVRLGRSHREGAVLVGGIVVVATGLHGIVFPGDPRYHHLMLPALAVSAAVGLEGLARRGRPPHRATEAV